MPISSPLGLTYKIFTDNKKYLDLPCRNGAAQPHPTLAFFAQIVDLIKKINVHSGKCNKCSFCNKSVQVSQCRFESMLVFDLDHRILIDLMGTQVGEVNHIYWGLINWLGASI